MCINSINKQPLELKLFLHDRRFEGELLTLNRVVIVPIKNITSYSCTHYKFNTSFIIHTTTLKNLFLYHFEEFYS